MACHIVNRKNGKVFVVSLFDIDTWQDFRNQFESRYPRWKGRDYAIFWNEHRLDTDRNSTIPGYVSREDPLYLEPISDKEYYLRLKQKAENKICSLYAEIAEIDRELDEIQNKLSLL